MENKIFYLCIIFNLLLIINSNIGSGSTKEIDISIIISNDTFTDTDDSAGPTTGGGSGGGGTPIKKEETPEKKCREQWICTNWSDCKIEGDTGTTSSNIQTIECYDYNECGTYENQPPLERPCEIKIKEEKPKEEQPTMPTQYATQLWIIAGIIVFIILSVTFLRRESTLKHELKTMKKQVTKYRTKKHIKQDITKVKRDLKALEIMHKDGLITKDSYKEQKRILNKDLAKLNRELKRK